MQAFDDLLDDALGDALQPGLRVARDRDWILMETGASREGDRGPLAALLQQSMWRGGAKLVATGSSPVLQAHVPVLDQSLASREWTARQIRLSSDSLLTAAGLRLGAQPDGSQPVEQGPDLGHLALACAAAGWQAAVKPDLAVAVNIPMRHAVRVIRLRQVDHAIHASVKLDAAVTGQATSRCAVAAGVFLMRASHALRWVRPFANGRGTTIEMAGFECFIAAGPPEQATCMAIDGLIAACELFGREAEALLSSPEIALAYLQGAGATAPAPWPDRTAQAQAPTPAFRAGEPFPLAAHFALAVS